jgi:hypothetical protein
MVAFGASLNGVSLGASSSRVSSVRLSVILNVPGSGACAAVSELPVSLHCPIVVTEVDLASP